MLDNFRERVASFISKEVPEAGETASSESSLYSSWKFPKFNPDALVGRKSLAIYDTMRVDDQVKACMSLKKNAVLQSGWSIEPASQDDADVEIAEFVEANFNNLQGTFSNNLKEIMSAMEYGYSITEKVWEIIEEGDHAGMWGLKALKTKSPHFFDFDWDEFRNLKPDGLINNIDGKQERLNINKFVIYSYQKEFGNWYGKSDLRSAYPNWWSKDNITKFWNIYLERFGSPLLIGKYKGSATGQNELKELLDNVQAKTSLTYRQGDYEIEMLEASRNTGGGKDAYESALVYHNKAISNALLVPSRVKDDGEGGARAESQVRFNTFLWVIEEIRRELEESVINEQIIRPLINFNFPNVEELPVFKFNPLTQDQKVEIVTIFGELTKKGAVVPTLEDENKIRDILGFPEKEEEDVVPPEETPKPPVQEKPEEVEEFKALADSSILNRVDFAEIDKTLTTAEETVLDQYQSTLTKQRDAVINEVSKAYVNNKVSFSYISGFELRFKGELKSITRKASEEVFIQGKKDGLSELPKQFKTAKQGQPLVSEEALAYLQGKADFVVKGINDPLLRDIQKILIDAIQSGVAVTTIIRQIEQAYIPYLSDGNVIIDDKAFTPFRIEAITRTTLNESYNWGRREVGEDPELEGFVIGYQYAEILDDRTTEISKFVNGKNIDITNPSLNQLSYPLHWNERGTFVYVTIDDQPSTFMSELEIATALAMKTI